VKVWIVGANGGVGSALVRRCKELGIPALGTSREEADICDLERLRGKGKEISPTHIVNCAAYTDVDGAEKDPGRAFSINRDGAFHVAFVAKELGARLVHLSTDYVFDGKGKKPYTENDPCSPINVYGMSKWEGEKRVSEILPSACILRTSWVFGQRGKNFISSLFSFFEQREEMKVVDDQCGKPTFCEDLVSAILHLLDAEGIVHFANSLPRSRYEIAIELLQAVKQQDILVKCERIIPVSSREFPTPAKRPSYSVLETRRYDQLTGRAPRPWTEALNDYLAMR
jgi:dTDP-4-dehydrorhamnose reductase